jgi:hypothetical protein
VSDLSNVRIDGQRLWDALMEMAKIGATAKGGCKRLTLTDLVQTRRLRRVGRCDGQHFRAPVRGR